MTYFLEIIKNGLEDYAAGNCVVVIKVVVCRFLLVNVETLWY
jgi:hypothetical protein